MRVVTELSIARLPPQVPRTRLTLADAQAVFDVAAAAGAGRYRQGRDRAAPTSSPTGSAQLPGRCSGHRCLRRRRDGRVWRDLRPWPRGRGRPPRSSRAGHRDGGRRLDAGMLVLAGRDGGRHPGAEGVTGDRLLERLGYRVRWTSWVLALPEGAEIQDRTLRAGYVIRSAAPDEYGGGARREGGRVPRVVRARARDARRLLGEDRGPHRVRALDDAGS